MLVIQSSFCFEQSKVKYILYASQRCFNAFQALFRRESVAIRRFCHFKLVSPYFNIIWLLEVQCFSDLQIQMSFLFKNFPTCETFDSHEGDPIFSFVTVLKDINVCK